MRRRSLADLMHAITSNSPVRNVAEFRRAALPESRHEVVDGTTAIEASIFTSIRDGRLRGMSAFRDKVTTEQIWQLARHVQTVGACSANTAALGRNDENQDGSAITNRRRGRPSNNRLSDVVPDD
jgi:mono/diheme cytochrome c family protein